MLSGMSTKVMNCFADSATLKSGSVRSMSPRNLRMFSAQVPRSFSSPSSMPVSSSTMSPSSGTFCSAMMASCLVGKVTSPPVRRFAMTSSSAWSSGIPRRRFAQTSAVELFQPGDPLMRSFRIPVMTSCVRLTRSGTDPSSPVIPKRSIALKPGRPDGVVTPSRP